MRRAPLKLWLGIALAAVLVIAVAGGSVMALDQGGAPSGPKSSGPPPAPISVLAVAPASGSTGIPANSIVAVRFSGPVDTRRGFPTLSPPVDGTWSQPSADQLVFLPSHPLAPFASETLTVTPAGSGSAGGLRARDGGVVSAPFTSHWRVAGGSTLRLQQLLAGLGYLPLDFAPTIPVGTDAASQDTAAFSPPAGTFTWHWPSTPPALVNQWEAGAYGPMTEGAVMAYEVDHGLAPDGTAGPMVWASLLSSTTPPTPNTWGYSYVQVTKSVPQRLTLWHNGAVMLTTPVNTGVPGDVTPTGTWPVFARYQSTTMRGVNPNGSHYSDPGVPFVNYFHGGDAVHGFTRAQYGYPQSDGCVELPLAAARSAYGLLEVGSLVAVQA